MNPDAIQDGGPAFPCEVGSATNGYTFQTAKEQWSQPGMTMRDYFAAKAMQGLLANGPAAMIAGEKKLVPFSFEIADAMLAARSQA